MTTTLSTYPSNNNSPVFFSLITLLAQDELFPQILEDLMDTLSKIARNELDKAHAEKFSSDHLPSLVKILVNQKYTTYGKCYRKANAFISYVIQHQLKILPRKNPVDAATLRRIFNPRKPYYDTSLMPICDLSATEDFPKDIKELGIIIEIKETYATIPMITKSKPFALNVNLFGQLGGFSIFAGIIAESEPKADEFLFVRRLLKIVANMVDYMNKDQWEKDALPIAKAGIGYLSKIVDDELKNVKEDDLKKFTTALQKLLKSPLSVSSDKGQEIVEEMEVEIAMKLLALPTMHRKSTGLNLILAKLNGLKQRWPTEDLSFDNKAAKLAEKLVDLKFFECLIPESKEIYPELIRRAGPVFSFLYGWRMLPGERLLGLWELAMASRDSLKASLIHVIETVALHASYTDSEKLLSCISRIPLAKFTQEIVSILQALGRNEYFRNKKKGGEKVERLRGGVKNGFGLGSKRSLDDFDSGSYKEKRHHRSASGDQNDTSAHLAPLPEIDPFILEDIPVNFHEPKESFNVISYIWTLVQEDSLKEGLSVEILKKLTELFVTLITKYFNKKCPEFMEKCERQLTSSNPQVQSMKIYTKLLEFMTRDKSFKLKPSVHEFTQKIVLSLIKFKRLSAQKALDYFMHDAKTFTSPADFYDSLITNEPLNISYYSELDQRLNFLRFLIVRGKLAISAHSIAILWQSFYLNSFSDRELLHFFDFMQGIIRSEPGVQLVVEGHFDSFLEEVLLRMDTKAYTPAAFNCLKDILITLNSHYKKIRVTSYGSFEVIDLQLIGTQVLWEIALDANDDEVCKSASSFLNEIYKAVGQELAEKAQQVKEAFIENCMRYIKFGAKAINESTEVKGWLSRALDLLHRYIQNDLSTLKTVNKSSQPAVQTEPEFIVTAHWSNRIKADIPVNKNTKVRDLLEEVKKVLERPESVDDLLFFVKDSRIMPTNETIWECGIKEPVTITVSVAFKEDYSMQNNQQENPQIQKNNDQSSQNQGQLQAQTQEPAKETITVSEEALETLASIYPTYKRPLLEAALRKANNNANNAAMYLLDSAISAELQAEAAVEESKKATTEAPTFEIKGVQAGEILANNEEYFGVLYSLLDCAVIEIKPRVWNILIKIPIGSRILGEYVNLQKASEVYWERVIPSDSSYKLLYSLRIIAQVLESEEKERWTESFISLGGFEHLCTILMLANVAEHGEEEVLQAIEAIVKTITKFSESAFDKVATEEYRLYLQKIIDPSQQTNQHEKIQVPSHVARVVLGVVEQYQLHMSIVAILSSAVDEKADSKVPSSLIKELLHLLSSIVCYNLKEITALYSNPSFAEYLLKTFVQAENETSKEMLRKSLIAWFEVFKDCNKDPTALPPDVFALNAFLGPIFNGAYTPIRSDTFFTFLGDLLYLYNNPAADSSIQYKLETLAEVLLNSIKTLAEKSETTQSEFDTQFTGLVHLFAKLLEIRPKVVQAIAETAKFDFLKVFCVELYGDPSNLRRKRRCVSKIGLTGVVQILLGLSKMNELYRTHILPMVCHFHEGQLSSNIKDASSNEISARLPNSYVGLKNFGCTCYINSLLQQLFMMVELREHILSLPAEKLKDTKFENVVPNLQKIFAYLLYSQNQYYGPSDFCKDFKGYNKQPINVRVQQDVDEFFNLLLDKAENELKAVSKEDLFREYMKIEVLQEINSLEEEFPYKSTKEEQYLSLPLDIKGKATIEDALDYFVKEEVLDNDNMFHCDLYNKKLKVSKKFSIKSSSKILIINLKRFEFNYATHSKRKLNDYCEFPLNLNLAKWMKPGSTETLYELVGVLVHSGTAEGGHYFSYIKERDKASTNYGKWFEFNDTRVSPFDVGDLKKKAFGGSKGSDYPEWGTSAYLLIYQKTNRDTSSRQDVVSDYSELIMKEQLELENARIFLDNHYQEFVKEYVKLWPIKVAMNMTSPDISEADALYDKSDNIGSAYKLAVATAHNLWERTKETAKFQEWLQIFLPCVRANVEIYRWLLKFLVKHKSALFGLLFENGLEELRSEYAAMLGDGLVILAKQEKVEEDKSRSTAIEFVKLLVNEGFAHARVNWKKFDEFFEILGKFASQGRAFVVKLVDEKLIGKLIDFVSNTTSALDATTAIIGERPRMGEKDKEVRFTKAVKLLSLLVRSCYTKEMRDKNSTSMFAYYPLPEMSELPMSEVELLFSTKWKYLDLLNHSTEDMATLLVHLSWENPYISKKVTVDLAKTVFDKRIGQSYTNELDALKMLLMSKDSLIKTKVKALLQVKADFNDDLYDWLKFHKGFYNQFVNDVLHLLAEIAVDREAAEVIIEGANNLSWVLPYINAEINIKQVGWYPTLIDNQEKLRKLGFTKRQFTEIVGLKEEVPKAAPEENKEPVKVINNNHVNPIPTSSHMEDTKVSKTETEGSIDTNVVEENGNKGEVIDIDEYYKKEKEQDKNCNGNNE